MSADDPPIYAVSPRANVPPTDNNIFYHHPFHVRAIVEAAEAVGIEVVADVPALGMIPPRGETPYDFAARVVARP